jgi:tetratricopeptide (TPR) repeat protein
MRMYSPLYHALAIALICAITVFALLPVVGNEFLNWDDPYVFQRNPQLGAPGVVKWAFTTTLMGHYQPLSWLVWSQVKTWFGLNAAAFHALSLVGHVLNSVLVYAVCLQLSAGAGLDLRKGRTAALVASLLFAVHPIRVEPVAWASAFPYVMSLAAVLLAFLAYLRSRTHTSSRTRRVWFVVSLCAYTVSLLARATAVAFPFVLLAVDAYPLQRVRSVAWRRLLVEKLPFLAVALASLAAESQAREVATLEDVGIGARLSMAVSAPFMYLGRTLAPWRLTPLDPLPIEPALEWTPLLLGLAGLAVTTAVVWNARRRWPALPLAWIAYLALLAPVMGLTPSGLQATADRYMYLPGVIVSIVAGVAVARVAASSTPARVAAIALALTVVAILAVATNRQTRWWHDSITLWTRTAELDPRNDVATFNLGLALEEAGRQEEAITRYEQTLHIVPDHTFARQNLARIRAERGMTLARHGGFAEAAAELRAAFHADADVPDVANVLAFTLVQTGRAAEAVDVLKRAVARHPGDINLTHNLARLLATAPDMAARDGATAVRLALEVRDRTGGRDPRVLDTLAAAYAAVGKMDLARATGIEAAALARQLGDRALAAEIEAHTRSFAADSRVTR